jgi:hypothetical protein
MIATLGFSKTNSISFTGNGEIGTNIVPQFGISGLVTGNYSANKYTAIYPLKDKYISFLQYEVIVTNYTKLPITYLYMNIIPVSSDTEHVMYEFETVIKKSMINHEKFGEICLKEEEISKKRRKILQVTKMVTNDWENMKMINYSSCTNILIFATNSSWNLILGATTNHISIANTATNK